MLTFSWLQKLEKMNLLAITYCLTTIILFQDITDFMKFYTLMSLNLGQGGYLYCVHYAQFTFGI